MVIRNYLLRLIILIFTQGFLNYKTADAQFGDFVASTDNTDGGYFPVNLKEGLADTAIQISEISAATTDSDGSEIIAAIEISDIPVGAVLSDGSNNFTATLGSTAVM